MIVARAAAVLAITAALAGCAGETEPEPSDTAAAVAAECAAAVDDIIAAVDHIVAEYESSVGEQPAGPTPGATPLATPGPESGDALAEAVAAARDTRERLGCDADRFTSDLESGLAGIEPEGPIATAVLRRVSGSLLGTTRRDAGEWALSEGVDLHQALAEAAEGSTILLPAGSIDVEGTLVLLEGVTLRGAGREATTIRAASADAAILIATGGRVSLEDFGVELVGDQPASGIVAGPSASVALTGVRVAGARAAGDGVGGAGVYLSAEGAEGAGRGTTLQITDSIFERNEWAGVAVAGGHRVSIESTTFARNGQVGALFLDSSSGSIGGSTFIDNAIGVAISGTATPAVLASTLTGGSVGVQADASAEPAIDTLGISGASAAAVIFGGASGGSISGVECEDVPYGIVISDTAAPTLRDNSCGVARGGS